MSKVAYLNIYELGDLLQKEGISDPIISHLEGTKSDRQWEEIVLKNVLKR